MEIQERLLTEQLQLVGQSELGRVIMGDDPPQDLEGFRRRVPVTTYADYAPYLDEKREDVLATETVAWAHTSGRSGRYKWAPYNATLFTRLGEGAITAMILASARRRGEVRLEPGDTVIYNTPARPYMGGYVLQSLAELFEFRFAPPTEVTEQMSFGERIRASFSMALRSGVDHIGSISSVLIKIGEGFVEGKSTSKFSLQLLHPAVQFRLARAMLRSRLAGRPMLPKDLWRVKGLVVGGGDTDIYRDQLRYYWGVEPHEVYACTEAPSIMACHAWDHKGLYFLPDINFYEFIPEAEREKERADETYIPKTVLLDEVEIGPRYEVVITSFYGAPFLRYRLYDLVRFTSLRDEETGIELPAMAFVSRDVDLIDLAGFTGVIDEKGIWKAIVDSGVRYEEWAVRKEQMGEHAGLHLYIELKEDLPAEEVAERVHQALASLNSFYADLESFLDARPLRATLLSPGTFGRYMREQQAAGADLAHLKPAHMNASDAIVDALLRLSEATT